jgi:hypothetical protein
MHDQCRGRRIASLNDLLKASRVSRGRRHSSSHRDAHGRADPQNPNQRDRARRQAPVWTVQPTDRGKAHHEPPIQIGHAPAQTTRAKAHPEPPAEAVRATNQTDTLQTTRAKAHPEPPAEAVRAANQTDTQVPGQPDRAHRQTPERTVRAHRRTPGQTVRATGTEGSEEEVEGEMQRRNGRDGAQSRNSRSEGQTKARHHRRRSRERNRGPGDGKIVSKVDERMKVGEDGPEQPVQARLDGVQRRQLRQPPVGRGEGSEDSGVHLVGVEQRGVQHSGI